MTNHSSLSKNEINRLFLQFAFFPTFFNTKETLVEIFYLKYRGGNIYARYKIQGAKGETKNTRDRGSRQRSRDVLHNSWQLAQFSRTTVAYSRVKLARN